MNMHPWYWFWKTLLHVTISTFFDVRIYGKENVPLTGSVLFVSNHQSFLDPPLCGMALHRECDFMARKTLFDNPGFGPLIRTLNSFPVEESGGDLATIRTLIGRVQQDRAVVVFPEGSRGFIKPFSKRYQLQRFGTGFARLAMQTKTPIVPIGIVGSEEQSPNMLDSKRLGKLIGAPAFPVPYLAPLGLLGFLPLPVKYRIFFGDPMQLDGDHNDDDAAIQHHVDRVRNEISLLIEEALAERQGWFS